MKLCIVLRKTPNSKFAYGIFKILPFLQGYQIKFSVFQLPFLSSTIQCPKEEDKHENICDCPKVSWWTQQLNKPDTNQAVCMSSGNEEWFELHILLPEEARVGMGNGGLKGKWLKLYSSGCQALYLTAGKNYKGL